MKTTRYLLTLLAMTCCYAAMAQKNKIYKVEDLDPALWKPGYVVMLKGDTVKGMIRKMRFADLILEEFEYKVVIIGDDGLKRTISSMKSRGYSYRDGANEVRLVSVDVPGELSGAGVVFCEIPIDGPCQELVYYEYVSNGYGQTLASRTLIRIKSDMTLVKEIGFKHNMREFFASCPLILKGIEEKKYGYDNWEQIVRDYNAGTCR